MDLACAEMSCLGHWIPELYFIQMMMLKPCPTLQKESTQERERRRNKRQGLKSRQANSPKEAGHKEVREPLNAETSNSHLKHIN
jgi:hypothetical protein